jgi:hypothetical protein
MDCPITGNEAPIKTTTMTINSAKSFIEHLSGGNLLLAKGEHGGPPGEVSG